MKPVRKIRSLTEVMDELERNPMKYCHDLPKQPPGPTFIFINENREKFVGKKGKMTVVSVWKCPFQKLSGRFIHLHFHFSLKFPNTVLKSTKRCQMKSVPYMRKKPKSFVKNIWKRWKRSSKFVVNSH